MDPSYFPKFILVSHKQLPLPLADNPLGKILQSTPKCKQLAYGIVSELFTLDTRRAKEFSLLADKLHNLPYSRTHTEETEDTRLIVDIISCWGSALVAQDLMCGVKPTARYNKTLGEFYFPNMFARQFGLVQSIPLAYESKVTHFTRPTLSANDIESLTTKSVEKLNHLKYSPFPWLTAETSAFVKWWPLVTRTISLATCSIYVACLIIGHTTTPVPLAVQMPSSSRRTPKWKTIASSNFLFSFKHFEITFSTS